MAKRPLHLPDRSEVDRDTPLRLDVAAALAFPSGGMTASGLRRERDAGRLATELIAGKEFTTLADIARMRELCRRKVDPKPDTGRWQQPGVVDAEAARATAAAYLAIDRLKAKIDAKRKAEREARQKEREAARAGASARLRSRPKVGRPPKLRG